jgi:apolipoprotein D and lipocalin family protein
MTTPKQLTLIISAMALSACSTSPPLRTVPQVDLERFMGDWYVIANIPTFIERKAHNAVESYELIDHKQVATTFRFNQGSFDGPVKTYRPTGFVGDDPSNAIWGMQFIWPIKADYRITYLTPDYGITVIARQKRDYVWVMARKPQLTDAERKAVEDHVAGLGYDLAELRYVPQRWGAAP